MPFAYHRLGFRVFTFQAPDEQCDCSRDPLLGFGASSEVAQAPSRCLGVLAFPGNPTPGRAARHSAAPPLRFPTPSAFPHSEQRLSGQACLPDRLRLQVFATSWRLHPPRACRPYSMPDPLLGSPSRALFLPRSRTLSPAPFPSWPYHGLQGLAPRESPPLEPAV